MISRDGVFICIFFVFGLWGAPVVLLVFGFGSGLFLGLLPDAWELKVEEVDSLASFAS